MKLLAEGCSLVRFVKREDVEGRHQVDERSAEKTEILAVQSHEKSINFLLWMHIASLVISVNLDEL